MNKDNQRVKTAEKDPNQAVTLNIGEEETERTLEGMKCEKAVIVRWLREIIVTGRTKAPKLAQIEASLGGIN